MYTVYIARYNWKYFKINLSIYEDGKNHNPIEHTFFIGIDLPRLILTFLQFLSGVCKDDILML